MTWAQRLKRVFRVDLVTCRHCVGSYGQIWCMPMKSSGDLVRLLDLFSVNEFHTFNDLRQIRETA